MEREQKTGTGSGEDYLTSAKCEQLAYYEDCYGVQFRFANGRSVVDMNLYLSQQEDDSFTEKDGIYVVSVYMDDGVIDDMLYDSGLAANQ